LLEQKEKGKCMKQIDFLAILLLISFQCTNQPATVNAPDQSTIDDYISYVKKPALTIHLSDQDISIDDTVDIGTERIIVKRVYWPATDSSMLNDSGWFACHDMVTMSCYGEFRFGRKGTVSAGNYEYPEYLCIEYQYKNKDILDTIFLDSVARFCTDMSLSTTTVNGKHENNIIWHNESVENANMKIKYMEIAVDNGLTGAEYYRSYPDTGTLKDGEPDHFEGYRYWHAAFSVEDHQFRLMTEQHLLPFVRTDILVKTYSDYNIRISIVKNYN
jgi:hypothetical protein